MLVRYMGDSSLQAILNSNKTKEKTCFVRELSIGLWALERHEESQKLPPRRQTESATFGQILSVVEVNFWPSLSTTNPYKGRGLVLLIDWDP